MATKKASSTKKSTSKSTSSPRLSVDRRWEAQDALRTLQRAQEIQGNKTLMSQVKREAQQQMAAISKVTK
jgi:hypothetical protein